MIKERRKRRRMTRRGGEKRGVIKRKRNIKKTFFRVPFFFSIGGLSRRGFFKINIENRKYGNYSLIISLGIDEVRLVHN